MTARERRTLPGGRRIRCCHGVECESFPSRGGEQPGERDSGNVVGGEQGGILLVDLRLAAVEAHHPLVDPRTVTTSFGPFSEDGVGLGQSADDHSAAILADQLPVLHVGPDHILMPGEVELSQACGPPAVAEADHVL